MVRDLSLIDFARQRLYYPHPPPPPPYRPYPVIKAFWLAPSSVNAFAAKETEKTVHLKKNITLIPNNQ